MIHNVIKENAYYDSVSLMLISSRVLAVEGIDEAAIMMGTAHNKELMISSGVLSEELASKATGNDLIIGIRAATQQIIDEALQVLDDQFNNTNTPQAKGETTYRTVASAAKANPEANFSVISVPGRYAKQEVMQSLKNGLHVLLFSDNISLEEEIELKEYAIEQGLLMMGPDCGTAIVNGVALGFANVVNRGDIGIVAASGTGLQEVTVLVDILGAGISQALGTGGRDLKDAVEARMALQGLDALENDSSTKVIGLISKPPSPRVLELVLTKLESLSKPVVVCFMGADPAQFENRKVYAATTLEDTARFLVALSQGMTPEASKPLQAGVVSQEALAATGQYIRALYTGGTLAYEAILLLQRSSLIPYSNITSDAKFLLSNPDQSQEHTVVDLGDDYFTDGMAHPMIDPRNRSERIVKEASDPSTAVILLDCVIGYGSHENPAAEIVSVVDKARRASSNPVTYIASVTGTNKDPQVRSKQEAILEAAGIIVLPTNAQAVQYAALVIQQLGER